MKFYLRAIELMIGRDKLASVAKLIASLSRKLATRTHQLQYKIEWGDEKTPEWFDHFIDHYYLAEAQKNFIYAERGVFNLLAIKQGATVLDLCCGDGYNSNHFYSKRADKITAIDFDPKAIKHARKHNQCNNIEYNLGDIRTDIPEGFYDNILWDAGISHFTSVETHTIMRTINSRLGDTGILSGYTIAGRNDGTKSLSYHEHEYSSKMELLEFLKPFFKNVKIFETNYPERKNFYFFASNAILPFDEQWPNQVNMSK